MKYYPKISIVTPVFNRVHFVENTILSVIEQNYPNLEYIIIDGGSTDGTVEIIKKYENYLAYWISEPDEGMYHALEKGLRRCNGEIMAWINSDDKYHAGAFFNVAKIFNDLPEVEWITGTPSLYNKEGLCVKVYEPIKWSTEKIYTGEFRWIQQESVFWRSSLYQKCGYCINVQHKYAADFELWVRFFKNARLYTVNTVLGGFRFHNNQLSIQNQVQYEAEVAQILNVNQYHGNLIFLRARMIVFFLIRQFKKLKLTRLISVVLRLVLDRFYKFPGLIYFDFTKNIWKTGS